MADLIENPMGLDGFEFVEFAAREEGVLEPVFEMLGFNLVAKHRSKNVHLWRQGGINLITNYEPDTPAAFYADEHGPSACAMAFRVEDAARAYNRALELGAQPVDVPVSPMELKLPAIRGIGGTLLYLIDRHDEGTTLYDIDFTYLEGVEPNPSGCNFTEIDHLNHNVYRGRMDYWADYYEKLFNFREVRFFDIKGEYTGLQSRAMAAPDGKIRIPLNEEAGSNGQIEEFLMSYNGEGMQHIAFICEDLPACLDKLKARGLSLMTPPPDTYYEMLEERLPGHGEPLDELKSRGILLDGTTKDGESKLLLQIFSQNLVGPIFFEFIERKRDEGFGEGNFKALFESMERDQIRRGVLDPGESASA